MRIFAPSTCRDLSAMVGSGSFRSDLYYRIKGATVSLPPFRARADKVALVEALLGELCVERGLVPPSLAAEAIDVVTLAPWRVKLRELKAAPHHALVLADGSRVITAAHLPPDLLSPHVEPASRASPAWSLATRSSMSRHHAELTALEHALTRGARNLSEAARSTGVARSTPYRLMRRHGLK